MSSSPKQECVPGFFIIFVEKLVTQLSLWWVVISMATDHEKKKTHIDSKAYKGLFYVEN